MAVYFIALEPGMPHVGRAVAKLAAAAPSVSWDERSAVAADVDCDGKLDYAFLGRAGGRVYVGVVHTGGVTPEVVSFAVGGREQAAICSEPASLVSEPLADIPAAEPGVSGGFRVSATCRGLALSGM
jgi:hypothetical protein